jgi:hypothetical protein
MARDQTLSPLPQLPIEPPKASPWPPMEPSLSTAKSTCSSIVCLSSSDDEGGEVGAAIKDAKIAHLKAMSERAAAAEIARDAEVCAVASCH